MTIKDDVACSTDEHLYEKKRLCMLQNVKKQKQEGLRGGDRGLWRGKWGEGELGRQFLADCRAASTLCDAPRVLTRHGLVHDQ